MLIEGWASVAVSQTNIELTLGERLPKKQESWIQPDTPKGGAAGVPGQRSTPHPGAEAPI